MWTVVFVIGVAWLHLPSSMAQKAEIYRCPKGLGGDVFTFREKCYQFITSPLHWDQAQSQCKIKGGNLVHIHDQATQNFIYNAVKHTLKWPVNGMWIGIHDQRVANLWEWVQGNHQVPGKSMTWSNWGSNQPSCGIFCFEHCGQMRLDDYGRWHDVQCHATFLFREEKYRYSCMYDMRPRTTTTTTTRSTTPTSTTTTTSSTLWTTVGTNATTENSSTAENTTFLSSPPTTLPVTTGKTRNHETAVDQTGRTTPVVAIDGTLGASKVESHDDSVQGGTVAGIVVGSLLALCLFFLLLLVFLRRRKQKESEERPSENFQNQTYSGDVTAAGPALAYVNPQAETATYLNPTLSVRLPEKTEEKLVENPYNECLDNHYNACAAAADMSDDDDTDFSKGVYEDIKLDMHSDDSDDDDDLDGMKNKTPSVEYLHARSSAAPTGPAPIDVPPRNLFSEGEHAAEDNIYVPMATGNENDPVYQ